MTAGGAGGLVQAPPMHHIRLMRIDPDIVIVIASLATALGFSSVVAGWVERRVSWPAVVSLGVGLGLLAVAHLGLRADGLSPRDIPDAFIHVAAMILN